MIFQHTWKLILEGKKTQTRRIVKPSEDWATDKDDCLIHSAVLQYAVSGKMRVVYAQGRVYTVTPSRTAPAIWWQDTNPLKPFAVEDIRKFCLEYKSSNSTDDDKTWLKKNGYCPLQIKITQIRREDVRNISNEDIQAEGFDTRIGFLITWAKMHDKVLYNKHNACVYQSDAFGGEVLTRKDDYYQAWALTFEVVK